ncbi:MAG: quinone oxidoreductase [Burkholderiaceae bacterium]
MSHAAIIHQHGDTSVFSWESVNIGDPKSGEVRVRHTAIGVNFADTYHRRGIKHPIPLPALPLTLGLEAVGIVIAVGADTHGFAIGDKVAYCMPPIGSYCEERIYPANHLVKVSPGLDDVAVAGIMMTGMTARMLLFDTYRVKQGDFVLIHAAAGGMGHVLCPWARALGATVIGTVGTDEKAPIATKLGCHHVINYNHENFSTVVKEITNGVGCHVVYESIGKTTLRQSLASLRPMGMCAAYGHASGAPEPVDIIEELGKPGALFITRPALHWYIHKQEDLQRYAADVFEALRSGVISSAVNHQYPLKDVAKAHGAIEDRKTTGSTVLIP